MDLNDIAQWIGVGIAMLLAVLWIVRRIRRKKGKGGCDCGCDGCPLKEKCK